MFVRRLSWAGIELTEASQRVLVDPLEDTGPLVGFLGPPRTDLVPVPIDEMTWALITHIHPDHCDRRLLARLPARHVLCHQPIASALNSAGIAPVPIELWEGASLGPFRVTPVPSQDWRGDDQVAWVINCQSRRVIHCGDTIWHGRWYEIARRHGPFNVAFLPINGVIARLEGFTPTDIPATLTPEQAIEAAIALRANTVCAIHHSLFNNPPLYVEQPNAMARFEDAAARRRVRAITPVDGGSVEEL